MISDVLEGDLLTAESQDSTLDAYRRGQVPLFG